MVIVIIYRWYIGLSVSLAIGHLVAGFIRMKLYSACNLPEWYDLKQHSGPALVTGSTTGLIERTFFTIIVGLGYVDILGPMMAWLGLKLGANWIHPILHNKPLVTSYAFIGLLVGLISMLFAYFGGLICQGRFF